MAQGSGLWHAAKCGPSINCAGQDVPNFPCNLNKRYAFGQICNLLRPNVVEAGDVRPSICARRCGAGFFVARAPLKALPGLLFAPVTDPVLFSNKFEFEKGSLAPVHIDRLSDFKPRDRGSNFSVNRTRIIPLFFPLIFPLPLSLCFSLVWWNNDYRRGTDVDGATFGPSSEIFSKGSL